MIKHSIEGYDVIFVLSGKLTEYDVRALVAGCEEAYEELGDAMGIIIDRTNIEDVSLRAQMSAQSNLKRVTSFGPVIIVGSLEPVTLLILTTFQTLYKKSNIGSALTVEEAKEIIALKLSNRSELQMRKIK